MTAHEQTIHQTAPWKEFNQLGSTFINSISTQEKKALDSIEGRIILTHMYVATVNIS